ncbi:MAG: UvrD-helicase domain-containing protein [Fusobacterium sp.]|uniref:ATP-dependent helicase n=1 Tax=Fusobacterium sp. TaxID=68766 RepID=UPI0015A6D4D6|nr:UvrD-helicase domain-containing protein [Fusobacterium sp.]MDY3058693.1 UvrD-helicase domain-containing protein [Fusobacterium sp.]
MSILDRLNDRQREAASKIEGALLILAGAGSGKTRTITYRIAHMIKEIGISPYSILAVTFTNKAAKEMRERVEDLIGEDAKKTMVSTFHSFGLRLLRIYGDRLGYSANFSIYDVDDQKRVVKGILKELVVKDKSLTEGIIASKISKLKEEETPIEEYEKSEGSYNQNAKIIAEVYRRYNIVLKNNNGMDFSDILVNTKKILEIPDVLNRIQEKFRYIMVDEYQDTNNIQYNIINKIAKKYGNICVVGDENQSIYGFRGANIQNILDFEKDYPDAEVVKLEENYRSTSVILDAANAVIKNNTSARDKKLWTKKTSGEKIKVLSSVDGREEVSLIVNEILKGKIQEGKKYRDFTILYRINAQSRLFEEGFLRSNIPYKVFGGMQFYQRAEIKDIIAYLSVINNTQDSLNLTRILNVPKRKIGDKSLEKINDFAKENGISVYEALGKSQEITTLTANMRIVLSEFYEMMEYFREISESETVSELFKTLINKIKYYDYLDSTYEDAESRRENIEELKNSIKEMEEVVETMTLREYLENVSLVSATDNLEEERDYVKLMTIHNSKGLEFPNVFIAGMEDEIFPGQRAMFEPKELEEERRLCYVAITRAEDRLYISYAANRFMYGQESFRTPSKFIDEIPENLLERNIKMPEIKREKPKSDLSQFKKVITLDDLRKNAQTKSFPYSVGEKVFHKKFGLGVVRGVNEKKVEIDFVDGRREIAMAVADKFLTKN